jgi:hypothetical protein
MCAKCLQIDLLPGATEHLLGTEGLDEPCSERLPANGSVSQFILVWSSRTKGLATGDRSWGQDEQSRRTAPGSELAGVARVVSVDERSMEPRRSPAR